MLEGSPENFSLYASYREDVEGDRLARSLRMGVGVVMILNFSFIPLDSIVFPSLFAAMLATRLVCNLLLLPIVVRTYATHPLPSTVAGCIVTGLMLLGVIQAAGGVTSDYTPGLMLLFLGMPVLLPLSARQSAAIVGTLLLAFASLPIWSAAPFELQPYLLHLVFPLAAAIESVAACAVLDKMRFADFARRLEVERARDELKKLDLEKSRFTANIHHELRTPLTLMLAPLEGMLGGDFGAVSELQNGYMKSMHSNGLRLLKLINNLLDLAKIEGKQLKVTRSRRSMGDLVRDTLAGARPLAERKGVCLEMYGLAGLPDLFVDSDAVEKILINLVGNALKFTEAGGRIDVRGEVSSEGGVHLVIADTGLGIPPEQLGRIFDRFAQVDSSSTRKHEGTGIGLSLVHELVGLHGGRVWAESEGEGHGAEMHLEFPIGEPDRVEGEDVLVLPEGNVDHAKTMAAMAGELDFEPQARSTLVLADLERNVQRSESRSESTRDASARAPADAPEVLVVEDNPDMRKLLVHLLGREFNIRTARNGREGLEAAYAKRPDLILTDVMMPEMTGTELCGAIKQDPEMCGIPVMLVTSKAEREMKIEGLELGADDYVAKPFHPRELMARARSLVRLRRLQDEVIARNVDLEKSNRDLARALDDLRETEVQLVQAERLAAVGELAAGVAHEVNNPVNFAANALRALGGYVEDVRVVAAHMAAMTERGMRSRDAKELDAQLIELEKLCEEREIADVADTLAELVAIATEGMQRTSRLVGDLRDFAAPGCGDDLQAVDVAHCLRTTLQLVRHTLGDSGVEVSMNIEESLPRVMGNAGALNQVFLNLLKNAAEALEAAGGAVSVVAARDGGGALVVRVEDDGPGMTAEVQERLFEPFFSTKGAGRGTGLGLSISRRIVTDLGGSIDVKSTPGSGTCFSVRLPVEQAKGEEGRSES